MDYLVKEFSEILKKVSEYNESGIIELLNKFKELMHEISPMNNEPVDCVLWISHEKVNANKYNPNKVAPPEMRLLEHSILVDGYTQPIVSFKESNDNYIIVDGFHRGEVGKRNALIKERLKGYLPITKTKSSQTSVNDRISSTIRHNRARGKHGVNEMSEIVLELKRRNWSSERIKKELGMGSDEVLRFSQIAGLREMYKDVEYSKAWIPDI